MKKTILLLTAMFVLVSSIATAAPKKKVDALDASIREASDYLNVNIPKGNKAVFLNVNSIYPDLSEYILAMLSENAVNDKVFLVVDRAQLDAVRAELNFQFSGEVDDNSAQEIGKMLGAQTIVSGAISKIGTLQRLQVKAIEVQTVSVQGQWSTNLNKSTLLTALTKNQTKPAASGTASSATAGTRTQTAAARGTVAAPAAQSAAPAVAPAAPTTIANGTYTFWPRPRAMREGRDINAYLDKIVVRGGYFNLYVVASAVSRNLNNPDLGGFSWPNRGNALITNLAQPNRQPISGTKIEQVIDDDKQGVAFVYTFNNHNIRRFSFELPVINRSSPSIFVFEEIDLDKAEYEP